MYNFYSESYIIKVIQHEMLEQQKDMEVSILFPKDELSKQLK